MTSQGEVLACLSDAFGSSGGIATFNRDLLRALSESGLFGEVVALPRLIDSYHYDAPPGVRFVQAASYGKIPYVAAAMAEAARARRLRLVLCGHLNLLPLAGTIARARRVPLVLVVYGREAWCPVDRLLVNGGIRKLSAVVSISQLTLERLQTWANLGTCHRLLLPPSVDLSAFTPGDPPEELRKRYGLAGRTVLLTLGRLDTTERTKGFDEVILALARVAVSVPNVTYLICGAGSDMPRLQALARTRGVAGRVVFSGFVKEEEKAAHYRLADAYVMPSQGEGFGIAVLEALACGIPALGSLRDGTREALSDGEFGTLVDPAEPGAVAEGIFATLRRRRGRPAGLDRFSADRFTIRTSELFRQFARVEAGSCAS